MSASAAPSTAASRQQAGVLDGRLAVHAGHQRASPRCLTSSSAMTVRPLPARRRRTTSRMPPTRTTTSPAARPGSMPSIGSSAARPASRASEMTAPGSPASPTASSSRADAGARGESGRAASASSVARSTTVMSPGAAVDVVLAESARATSGRSDRGERGVGRGAIESRAQMRAQVEQRRAVGIGARGAGRAATRSSAIEARRASAAPGANTPESAWPIDAASGGAEPHHAEQEHRRERQRRCHQCDRLDACLGSFPHAATMAARPVTDLGAGVTRACQDASGRALAARRRPHPRRSRARAPRRARRLPRRRACSAVLARDREVQRLTDDGLQLGQVTAHRAQVGAQGRRDRR